MIKKGKSRVVFLLSFIFKLGIVILFFAINGISKAEARLSEASMFHNNETVLVQTENSGSCSYEEISIGTIDLNVNANEHYGDVAIQVTINNITYDDSYDKAVVGEYMNEFQDLVASKEGPWDLGIRYALESKSLIASLDDSYCYDVFFADKSYSNKVIRDGATTRSETDLITVDNTSNLVFTIKLGNGASNTTLPTGSYCLHISLTRGELVGLKASDIGVNRVVKLAFLSYRYAFLHMQITDIFNFDNIVGLIAIMYSIATAFYFYPDIKSAKEFYDKKCREESGGSKYIIKKTFTDPYNGNTYTTTETTASGPSLLKNLLLTALYFVGLVIIVPIRFFVYLVKDLIAAIRGNKPYSVLYGLGCLIGSMGLWLVLSSIVFFLAYNWIMGAIFAGVGIGALIGAHFLANENNLVEEED